MSEIRFYHLTRQPLDQALPAILMKAYTGGRKVLVHCADKNMAKKMSEQLWTYRDDSFLPHGLANEDHANLQPVLISDTDENQNEADVLILCGGALSEKLNDFSLCCEMLEDHQSDQVEAARARWKDYKEAGHEVTYWFQSETGGWEQKA